jgi:outer membrane protein TolC
MLVILLLLQAFKMSGQTDSAKILTVEEAVDHALRNNTAIQVESDRKKLTGDVKAIWFQWLFQINEWQTLREHLDMLIDLNRVASLRYEKGDIDLLEKSWFLAKLAEIKTETAVLATDIDITGNLLRQLINSNERIVPSDSSLSIYQIIKGSVNVRDPETLFSSLALENLRLELDKYFIRLQYYRTVGLDHAQLILKINRAKFEAEEIDYLEFIRTLAEAFNIKMEYLKTLNSYNQIAIELEHYAY